MKKIILSFCLLGSMSAFATSKPVTYLEFESKPGVYPPPIADFFQKCEVMSNKVKTSVSHRTADIKLSDQSEIKLDVKNVSTLINRLAKGVLVASKGMQDGNFLTYHANKTVKKTDKLQKKILIFQRSGKIMKMNSSDAADELMSLIDEYCDKDLSDLLARAKTKYKELD